ncbi:MAG: hypothetical protein S4CHLAM7_01120 [Chlamydiae bacterium]|nr:hypothetical protein [Chlamydiota bacterium]
MFREKLSFLFIFLSFSCQNLPAFGPRLDFWNGGADADWNTGSSWERGVVPRVFDAAEFRSPETIVATGNSIEIAGIQVTRSGSTTSLTIGEEGGELTLNPTPGISSYIDVTNTSSTMTLLSELLPNDQTFLRIDETSTLTLDKLTTTFDTILRGGFYEDNPPAGTLVIREFGDPSTPPPTGLILQYNANLTIAPNTAGLSDTYNSSITNVGSLTYAPTAANTSLNLTGTLNYSGNTTLSAGTLRLSGTFFQPTTSQIILSDDTDAKLILDISNNSNIQINKIISESENPGAAVEITSAVGSLLITENILQFNGPLSITGNVLYTATESSIPVSSTTVNGVGAQLTIRGMTFENDLFLTNGKLLAISNSGLPDDGSEFAIGGSYTQSSGGTLSISVMPNEQSSGFNIKPFTVTGTASLEGTLEINDSDLEGAGITAGSGTLLTSSNRVGEFTTITAPTYADLWSLSYPDNNVVLTLSQTIQPTRTLQEGAVNQDVEVNNLLNENFDTLIEGENGTWFLALNALPLAAYQTAVDSIAAKLDYGDLDVRYRLVFNGAHISDILDKQYKEIARKSRFSDLSEMPSFAEPNTGLFFQPFGNIWHQNKTTKRRSFKSGSYGAALGWNQLLGGHFIYEAGVAYSHSNLSVKKSYSQNVRYSSIYLSPAFFGWFNARGFANIMALATIDFFKYSRVISYPGLRRVAQARYNAYEILLRADGGYRIPLFKSTWFQPEATLNFETLFEEGYEEKGAGTLGLQQKKTTNYLLNPRICFRMIWETLTDRFCWAPSLYVGWLSYISLNEPLTSVRFANVPSMSYVQVEGYKEMINQIILGGAFYMKRFETFDLTGDFQVDLLNQIQTYKLDVKLEWFF